jgi:membrane protein
LSDTITDTVEALLWSPRTEQLSRPAQTALFAVRFIYAVIRDVISGDITMRAMGLVYVTILSIVPVIAVIFSILKGFGVHKRIEPFLYTFLEPLGEKGVEITDQIIGLVDNVQGNVLAGAGLILLFFTTISMAQKVEDSFNFVWRVDHSRGIAQRLTEYLSVILIGPVLMVTAMTLLASVKSAQIVQELTTIAPVGESLVLISRIAPYLLVCFGFTLVYWFLPNTNVRFLPAAVGGVTGGLLWATSGSLFTQFVVGSTRTNSIYATFAIVIMALIWLYLCWLILLVGAMVSFYAQNPQHMRLGYRHLQLGSRQRERIALGLMTATAQAFRDGAEQPTPASIAEDAELPSLIMLPILSRLISAGLINRTDKDLLYPERDPATIGLREVIAAVRDPQKIDVFPMGHWPSAVVRVGDDMETTLAKELGDRSVYDLLDEIGNAPDDDEVSDTEC